MYVSTDTLSPHSSEKERTFRTPGPRATDTIKCGVRGRYLEASSSRLPDRSCIIPWTHMPRASSSSRTTLSGICLPGFLIRRRTCRSSGREKMWKLTPLLQSRYRRALTVARKPAAVPGTIISFSAFSWSERLLEHCVLNNVRKPRVSEAPEKKMGVLTLSVKVVPAGMPSRGPDVSVDMCLEAAPEETAGSEVSEPLAEGLDGPLQWCGLAYPATTSA
jgi:hypothetical protein